MTRSVVFACSLAALTAAPAHALGSGQISVSASVVRSIVVRPVELLSVRRERVAGGARIVASLRPGGAGPVVVEQRGAAPVQLAGSAGPEGGRVSVVLPEGGAGQVIVTVFSDAILPAHHR